MNAKQLEDVAVSENAVSSSQCLTMTPSLNNKQKALVLHKLGAMGLPRLLQMLLKLLNNQDAMQNLAKRNLRWCFQCFL